MIENHKSFLDTSLYKMASPLEKVLERDYSPVTVPLHNGEYKINIPSSEFNTLFLSFHGLQHIGSGLCLHHLCDWTCLINRKGLHIPEEITDTNYLRIVAAFTEFTNRFLGTKATINCPEEDLETICHEMFRSSFFDIYQSKNRWWVFSHKVKNFIHRIQIRKKLTGETFGKSFFLSVLYHTRKHCNI